MRKGSVTIRLDPEVEERLDRLASETHRTKSFYIREAIAEHLDDLEDIFLAESRLEAIRSGREKTIPLEEMMKRYGLEN